MLRVRNQRPSKARRPYAAVLNVTNTVASNNVLARGRRENRQGTQVRPPAADSSNRNVVFEDGVFQVKQKHKETKITNFSQWMDAFLIYASIYWKKHILQVISLLRYMSTIKRGSL